jgi:hypothetical protein
VIFTDDFWNKLVQFGPCRHVYDILYLYFNVFCLQYDTHRVILSYEVLVMTGVVFMIVYCKYHKNTSIYKSPHNTNFIKRTTKWRKVSKLWHFICKNFISRSAKINQHLHFLWYNIVFDFFMETLSSKVSRCI